MRLYVLVKKNNGMTEGVEIRESFAGAKRAFQDYTGFEYEGQLPHA